MTSHRLPCASVLAIELLKEWERESPKFIWRDSSWHRCDRSGQWAEISMHDIHSVIARFLAKQPGFPFGFSTSKISKIERILRVFRSSKGFINSKDIQHPFEVMAIVWGVKP